MKNTLSQNQIQDLLADIGYSPKAPEPSRMMTTDRYLTLVQYAPWDLGQMLIRELRAMSEEQRAQLTQDLAKIGQTIIEIQ